MVLSVNEGGWTAADGVQAGCQYLKISAIFARYHSLGKAIYENLRKDAWNVQYQLRAH